jgi:hypothetical protein
MPGTRKSTVSVLLALSIVAFDLPVNRQGERENQEKVSDK